MNAPATQIIRRASELLRNEGASQAQRNHVAGLLDKALDAVSDVIIEAERCCGSTGDLKDLRAAIARAGVE